MKSNLLKSITLFGLAVVLIFSSSCSKDDSSSPSSKSHKVIFKALASSGSQLRTVAYGTVDNIITETSLSGSSWQSDEITVPSGTISASISMNGIGKDASSTLTVQIFVDGKLKNEGKSTGKYLSAGTNYSF